MRDVQTIEKEIMNARADLEDSLALLEHAIREKVDVRAQAAVLVERGKQEARELVDRGIERMDRGLERTREVLRRGQERTRDVFERGARTARRLASDARDRATDAVARTRRFVRERPQVAGAIIAAVAAAGALVIVFAMRNRRRRRRWLII